MASALLLRSFGREIVLKMEGGFLTGDVDPKRSGFSLRSGSPNFRDLTGGGGDVVKMQLLLLLPFLATVGLLLLLRRRGGRPGDLQ